MAIRIIYNSEFPAMDERRWRELARRALDGEDFDKALVSHTEDAIRIEPVYRRVPASHSTRLAPGDAWRIVQRIDDPDLERANRQAREEAAGGATGLALVFDGAPNAFGHGIAAEREALNRVLEGIPLDRLHLRIDPHPASRASIDWIIELYGARRISPASLSFSLGFDPAAIFGGTGRLNMSVEALQASLPQSLAHFFALGLPGVLMEADGRVYHNAGATAAQELGAMLSSAVWHLRMFQEARQPLLYSVAHIGFALSVDQDQFESVAKIRALRRLWARVQEACGIEMRPTTIHAETSFRMLTRADPETNILRNTIAAFSAGIGGADSVSVLGHTLPHGLPDGHARRIARNTQLILLDESHLGFVSDPAAGAGGFEALTDGLCRQAWEEFQAIEAAGGLYAVLKSGRLQDEIAAKAEERRRRFEAGELVLVGSNRYPAPAERPVATLAADPSAREAAGTLQCRPLVATRIDEERGGAS